MPKMHQNTFGDLALSGPDGGANVPQRSLSPNGTYF